MLYIKGMPCPYIVVFVITLTLTMITCDIGIIYQRGIKARLQQLQNHKSHIQFGGKHKTKEEMFLRVLLIAATSVCIGCAAVLESALMERSEIGHPSYGVQCIFLKFLTYSKDGRVCMNMCKSTHTCTYYSAVLVKITPLRDVVHVCMYVLVHTVLYQRHAIPICSSPCLNSNSNPNNSPC